MEADSAWRKSSFSTANGECVEVAPCEGGVLIRNTKSPEGPQLAFKSGEWEAFLAGVREGEFDLSVWARTRHDNGA